jgi:hypothetical protein
MLSNYQAIGLFEGFYEGSIDDRFEAAEIIADQFITNKSIYIDSFPRNIETTFKSFI